MNEIPQHLAGVDFYLCSGENGVCLLSANAINGMTDEPIEGGVTIEIPALIAIQLGSLLIEAGRARSN